MLRRGKASIWVAISYDFRSVAYFVLTSPISAYPINLPLCLSHTRISFISSIKRKTNFHFQKIFFSNSEMISLSNPRFCPIIFFYNLACVGNLVELKSQSLLFGCTIYCQQ